MSGIGGKVGATIPHNLASDPDYADTIILLTGDDNTNIVRNFSARGATLVNHGVTRNTSINVHSAAAMDLTAGWCQVEAAEIYPTLLGSDPFTLEAYVYVNSFPIEGNNRLWFFGPFEFKFDESNKANPNVIIDGTSYGTQDTVAFPVGVSTHVAVTRTNGVGDGNQAHVQLYVNKELVSTSDFLAQTGIVGGGIGGFAELGGNASSTLANLDGFRLTKAVNRYAFLNTIDPPNRFPIT